MDFAKNQNKLWLAVLSLSALLAFRTLPILFGGFANFGYDYGFYLFAIKNAHHLQLNSLLTALWGGFNNPLFYLANLLNIPATLTLNETYFFASIFTGLSFYLVFAKKNWQAGIFAILLLATSQIQAEMYSMFLWKNVVTIPFLLLSFKFLEEKRWWPLIFSSFIILLTHRTTAIIYLLTLIIYFAWILIQQKKYKQLGLLSFLFCVLLATCYFLPATRQIIQNLIYNNNFSVRTGLFLEGQNLLYLWAIPILLALAGIWKHIVNKQNWLWPIFTSVCLLWVFFHLPFYRRIVIYLDLAVIYFSAYFFSQLNLKLWQIKTVVILVFGFLFFSAGKFVYNRPMWISSKNILEIKNFKPKNPGDFVLVVSANDAPWVLGFGNKIRLGAPGLFEDRSTYQDWKNFWAGQNQTEFLWKYPRPLYFYQRSYKLQGAINNCLKPVSENFSEYICTN